MAKKQDKSAKASKAKPTMREIGKSSDSKKQPRILRAKTRAGVPAGKVTKFLKKEYHPVVVSDNKIGKVLNKRGRLMPKFLSEAWAEVRKTTWPNRRETIRLSIAVFIFSVIFGVVVAVLDTGLDKLFKEIIIK